MARDTVKEGVGQDPHEVGRVVGRHSGAVDGVARGVHGGRSRGEVDNQGLNDRGEDHVPEHPLGQMEGLAQALALQVPPGAVAEADGAQGREQGGGLRDNAQR